MTEQRFTLTTSANGKIKYINDSQMELSDRHGQMMGFIVEDDHEENVELLIEFLNKNCQYEQLLTNPFTWDNPIMYDKENGRCRCIPIPYKLQKKERLKMTDKFKLVKSEPHIENIETGECYDLDSDNFSYIVKVMNDLSNENKKLKQENERLTQLVFFANNQEKWEQKINDTK